MLLWLMHGWYALMPGVVVFIAGTLTLGVWRVWFESGPRKKYIPKGLVPFEPVRREFRRYGASTNVIESAFSIVETVCRNVKRWRPGDQIERWVGSGLLVAERQFRKVRGFCEIPLLLASLPTQFPENRLPTSGRCVV